ncbi:MAG TPA: DegT/DnrJ/EryC1/StrS family aminotransferase [Geminicoccus sp.]|jgi:dTDP-4-amino-4,6-dideoxygalactose transaminase|uniref:DegT/DnrJ/EryC1/StrS family aminotransferase n=1 Tax=Geminicoccus sp. TaxID=2024832 RepID=UPI002E37BC84|nr:DegT/DnrJ/EryC1/StrS family aminotransferase [Geminicoccus sp.]HEX2528079.1 DegT/DnrJ/EryC1/StrS family aminotransferase [Geminicoccus sp.]
MAVAPIPFVDLAAQRKRLEGRVEAAIQRVVQSGAYIMGPEVGELERQLAAHAGVRHVITCANGTQALELVLRAWGIGQGDAVFVPAFTFAATGEAPAWLGATPVFCDVEDVTFNLDPQSLEAAIDLAERQGLKPKAVIPVDLFGVPADYEAINRIAGRHGLKVLQDAAQSYGAIRAGKRAGAHADAAATSFYPAKPLGCYGDGGAMFTDDDELAAQLRSLRFHGMGGGGQYDNVRVGTTGRLDTIQAAVLLEKLAILDDEQGARQRVADGYARGLSNLAITPRVPDGVASAWAQYTLRVDDRDAIKAELAANGVPTMIYYPKALADQAAFAGAPVSPTGIEVSRRLTGEVLSLPMHPYLEEMVQARVIEEVKGALLKRAG